MHPALAMEAVDRLLVGATSEAAIRFHGLGLFEARRRRRGGFALSESLELEEQLAALVALGAPPLAARVRAAISGRIAVIKGPACAATYPEPRLRLYWDLDLLVEDAASAQSALLAEGFQAVGDPALYEGIHHLRPLVSSGLPLAVELHDAVKWPAGFAPPASDEILAAAVRPSGLCEGVSTLAPAAHAVILAAHSWAHTPLRRAVDLVDVAVVSAGVEEEAATLADAWGLGRIWATTIDAAGDLLAGHHSRHLRTWARDVRALREPTVLDTHLRRWLAEFGARPFGDAARSLPGRLRADLRPLAGEPLNLKARRSVRSALHAGRTRSEHDRRLAG